MRSQTHARRPSPRSSLRWLGAALALALPFQPLEALAQENEPLQLTPPAPVAQEAVSADGIESRLSALREKILARVGEPGVAADLYQLAEVAEIGGSLERVADTLSRVSRSRTHPEVRALAHRLLAEIERKRGRAPRMEGHLDAIGILPAISLIGPFDDDNKGGFDTAYGPERDLDLSSVHQGLRGEVRWRTVEGLSRTGTFAIDQAIRPSSQGIVYALSVLDVPVATQAVLYLGTPGGVKAWINGRPILSDPRYHPSRFDQASVPLRLDRGANVLLLKVAAGESHPFDLHLRVVGTDGRPVRGLKVSAPTSGRFAKPQALAAGRRILARRPLVDVLEATARTGRPQALLDYARVLGERHPFDESEKAHVAAAARAARANPSDVDAQLLAARWEDDNNARRSWYEKAIAAEARGEARAHGMLASWWLAEGDVFRTLRILEERLPQAEGDWPSHLKWVRALDQQGFEARGRRRLEGLLETYRDQPRLLDEMARRHRRDGQLDEAIRLWRVALAHRPGDEGIASSLASALVDRGLPLEADRVLENLERLAPIDVQRMLRRADLLSANGEQGKARILYLEAARVAPQDGEVFERAGQAELRAGETEKALAHFERSLQVRPQNTRLKELVGLLQPGGASFARPWLRDLDEAVAAAEGQHLGEDAVKLVDLTATRVLPSGQSSRTIQTIVQVHTQRGVDRYRSFPIRYAPGREEVKVERARVRKRDGSVVATHSESERSMNEPWSGLYYDARALQIGFPTLAPGDTVELVYRIDDVARDNLLGDYFGDVNYLQDTVPTIHWEYVLEMPAGRQIHSNRPEDAVYETKDLDGGRTLHRWTASGLQKVFPEADMPGWSEVASYLHVSTYADWQAVSNFWWGLVQDQVQPTQEIERVAKEIVSKIPASDVEGRVRAVHDFVLKNTRYVGLEFGIHSFKPYKVEQVLRRRFGDCKDKASLTYSLLRAVGIDSNLVLLRMRHLGKIGEEPASLAVFNHAILYVPSLELWLDGTAEWSGTRELPEADRGAEVLVVRPGGRSEFQVIPEATADLSGSTTEQVVRLDQDGSATIHGSSEVRGLPAPGYRRAYASPNGRKASFEQAMARSYPGITVQSLDISDLTRIEDDVRLAFELSVPTYAERRGDGSLAFSPFGDGQSYVQSFAPVSVRRHDLLLRHTWRNGFRHVVELPEGWSARNLPAETRVGSPFGEATVQVVEEAGKLVFSGTVALTRPRIHPGEYEEFRSFLGEIDRLFRRKVVVGPGGTASR